METSRARVQYKSLYKMCVAVYTSPPPGWRYPCMNLGPGAERGIGRTIDVRARHLQGWGGAFLHFPRHHPILELLPGEYNREKYIRLFSGIHIMYLAIDIVCVYAVLYRSIYHVKIMVEVIRSTQAWYAGHLGIPIPNWLIYLNLILSMDLASMDN
jgi:hypothetical protein